ncbi:MAG: hypothetical protein JWM21_749 [Acidobacteria bacterium]|nr:hypothetical protein [Acidobacteriota bacterium]
MIITCQNCTCRFRIDEAKVPAGSFTVACPKCQTTVSSTATSDANESSALGMGRSPSTSHPRFQRSLPAPLFRIGPVTGDEEPSTEPAKLASPGANELALSLISLLKPEKSDRVSQVRPVWDRRRVLVCTVLEHREPIAISLTEGGCEVFVAADTQQAVERMRESRVDVVILDQSFDPIDQGAAFVAREVSVLRPAQRRRIFFVLLSSSKRTMDAHAAFLQNVNAVVNFNELSDLPGILDRSIREYNELYKDFNVACGVASL